MASPTDDSVSALGQQFIADMAEDSLTPAIIEKWLQAYPAYFCTSVERFDYEWRVWATIINSTPGLMQHALNSPLYKMHKKLHLNAQSFSLLLKTMAPLVIAQVVWRHTPTADYEPDMETRKYLFQLACCEEHVNAALAFYGNGFESKEASLEEVHASYMTRPVGIALALILKVLQPSLPDRPCYAMWDDNIDAAWTLFASKIK